MSATYDNPIHERVDLGLFDFGGGAAEVMSIKGPAGMKGKLTHIGVSVTEVFAVDTATGKVRVGTAADNDAYGELNIADGTADEAYFSEADDTDAIISADIPADQLIEINLVNGTDGTAVTGQGRVSLRFEWYR